MYQVVITFTSGLSFPLYLGESIVFYTPPFSIYNNITFLIEKIFSFSTSMNSKQKNLIHLVNVKELPKTVLYII